MEYCDLNMHDEMLQGHITVHVLCYLKLSGPGEDSANPQF